MHVLAKMAYEPLNLIASLIAASLAGKVVNGIWRGATKDDELPDVASGETSTGKAIAAALIQAGVFALAHTLVDRAGAKLFHRVTGDWPDA